MVAAQHGFKQRGHGNSASEEACCIPEMTPTDVFGQALPRTTTLPSETTSPDATPAGKGSGSSSGGLDMDLLRQRIIVHLLRQVPMAQTKLYTTCSQFLQCGVLTYDVISELLGVRSKGLPQLADDVSCTADLSQADSAENDESLSAAADHHAASATAQSKAAADAAVSGDVQFPVLPGLLGMPSRFEQDFERQELLGRGAFGEVWRCRHRLDGHEYAVKMVEYHTTIADAGEVERRVLREAQTWASLNHPNIVRYHGAWVEVDWTNLGSSSQAQQKSGAGHGGGPLRLPAVAEASSMSMGSFGMSESDDGSNGVVFLEPSKDECSSSNPAAAHVSPRVSEPESPEAAAERQDLARRGAAHGGDVDDVALHGTFGYKAVLYIQTELCNKDTLLTWIQQRNAAIASGRVSHEDLKMWAKQAAAIFHQIVSALATLHEHNIVHRDVKPGNILFGADGAVRLGDFGLAKVLDAGRKALQDRHESHDRHSGSHHTRGVGTPSYASPEQLASEPYGIETDIHALGMILAELLCPVSTQMERAALMEGLRRGSGVPQDAAAGFPAAARLAAAMTDPDPSSRPSAQQLLKAHAEVVLEVQKSFDFDGSGLGRSTSAPAPLGVEENLSLLPRGAEPQEPSSGLSSRNASQTKAVQFQQSWPTGARRGPRNAAAGHRIGAAGHRARGACVPAPKGRPPTKANTERGRTLCCQWRGGSAPQLR